MGIEKSMSPIDLTWRFGLCFYVLDGNCVKWNDESRIINLRWRAGSSSIVVKAKRNIHKF